MHFVFDWSGQSAPVGAIAAVNESVWEHLKIAYWPTLFYSIIEYKFLKKITNNYYLAKAACIFITPIVIVTVFYTYTSILGYDILAIDILSFVLGIALGQIASYKLLTSQNLPKHIETIGLILAIVYGICFVVFTYYPPHISIFRDAETGQYGIV